MAYVIHSQRCGGCDAPFAPGDLDSGKLCKECRAALARGRGGSRAKAEGQRIRRELLAEIDRLDSDPEAWRATGGGWSGALTEVKNALDRICPEEG